MESLTSLLGCFEGCGLFLLLLLEGSVLLANLLLFLLGSLVRLQSATRSPERFRRISRYLEGLKLSSLTTAHFAIWKTCWLAVERLRRKREDAVKSKFGRFTELVSDRSKSDRN